MKMKYVKSDIEDKFTIYELGITIIISAYTLDIVHKINRYAKLNPIKHSTGSLDGKIIGNDTALCVLYFVCFCLFACVFSNIYLTLNL